MNVAGNKGSKEIRLFLSRDRVYHSCREHVGLFKVWWWGEELEPVYGRV